MRIIVIVYVGILLILYFQQNAMLFPAPAYRSDLPTINGLIETKITTPDEETLPGWYIAPQGSNPTILFFHGNGDQINTFGFLAEKFAAKGYGFASIEYRGYPGATGTLSEDGIMSDGLAAFDWVKQQCSCKIVLMAHSLGTGVAVHVAAERDVHAVALFAPYSAIADVAASRFWFLPVRYLIQNPIYSNKRIGKVKEPILMVHGDADIVIPMKFGKKLFALANEPKNFISLENIGHNEVLENSVERVLTLLGKI